MKLALLAVVITIVYFAVGTWWINKNTHGHGTIGDFGLWLLVVVLPTLCGLVFAIIACLASLVSKG